MSYWRMQLHPHESNGAMKHSVESLAAGFVGLDFSHDVGDLRVTPKTKLPAKHKDYWAFAHEMKEGDPILVLVHHFPFALATICSDYNYIRNCAPESGVGFRHFWPDPLKMYQPI